MRKSENESDDIGCGVVSYRAPTDLIAGLDRIAASEGISRSDVARRAALQAVQRAQRANVALEGADA